MLVFYLVFNNNNNNYYLIIIIIVIIITDSTLRSPFVIKNHEVSLNFDETLRKLRFNVAAILEIAFENANVRFKYQKWISGS